MYFAAYVYTHVLGRGLDKATKLVTEASLRVRGMRKNTGMQTSTPDENAAVCCVRPKRNELKAVAS